MILEQTTDQIKTPPDSVYCRAWRGNVTPSEMLQAIAHAIRCDLTIPPPRTPDQYLIALEHYPDRIRRWTRRELIDHGILRQARDVEELLADDEPEAIPVRLRRRILATLANDPEFAAVVRQLIGGGT